MPVSLGTQGQPDFDQPIALMMDCHRRIEHFLGVLRRVVDGAGGDELNDEQGRAMRTALDYFQSGAPHHTADEEDSLFPRMRRLNDAQIQAAMATIDHLEADHRHAEQAHGRLDQLGRQWLAEGRLEEASVREMRSLLDKLEGTYQEHIAVEDAQIFPLAQQALEESVRREVGQEMRARREAERDAQAG